MKLRMSPPKFIPIDTIQYYFGATGEQTTLETFLFILLISDFKIKSLFLSTH